MTRATCRLSRSQWLSIFVVAVAASLPFGFAHAQGESAHRSRGTKEMAVTFNELPAAQSFGDVPTREITHQLLEALAKHSAKATGFVVGANIGNDFDLTGEWLNGGHLLGSMTYSNQDINELSGEQFLVEIDKGAESIESMLSDFGQRGRYFRFPFLHYGSSPAIKKRVTKHLGSKRMTIAHATVVPDDYLYNMSLEKMGKGIDSSGYFQLMNEYVNHVLDAVERAEKIALRIAGRPVRQILLLRANRLNAVYLDDLLSVLEEDGYSFVPLSSALNDDIYNHTESYYGSRGVGFLEMIAQSEKGR